MELVATDLIQLISLPLELVGLTLTIIEIFHQERHLRIQKDVVESIERIDVFFNKNNTLKVGLVLLFFGLPVIGSLFFSGLPDTNPYKVIGEFWLFLFTGFFAATIAYNSFSKLLTGRKLLAFGIALTVFGIVGESFQVLAIF